MTNLCKMQSSTYRLLAVVLVVAVTSQVTLGFSPAFFNNLFRPSSKDVNGGGSCAACTALFTLLSHVKQYYSLNSSDALPKFCSFLPPILDGACSLAANNSGTVIAEQLDSGENGDVICHGLNYCFTEPGQPVCHLLPAPAEGFEKAIKKSIERNKKWRESLDLNGRLPDICNLPELTDLCIHIETALGSKEAVFDNDLDGFSTVDVLRGSNWRGPDCQENNTDVYPGRKPINEDREYDSNCNGIWGINPISGVAYETELCSESGPLGVVYFGDSVGAHFRVPPNLLDVTAYDYGAFDHLIYEISNELDWPELSYGTGHTNSTWNLVQNVSTNSIYWRLRNRNLCNHNDYHNRAYNGGRTSNILNNINFNTTRNRELDYPVLVIYAQMGNDVCNGHNDTVASMTTTEELRENVLIFLDEMERVLPPGSHVLTIGLLNGEVLRPSMEGHLHPLGWLNGDITYDLIYNWLNCLLLSPCLGWTSADEGLRNQTTQRANDLSATLEDISNTRTYENFDIRYYRIPVLSLYENYAEEYYKLVEPVDGFHPNRISQNTFAVDIWAQILAHFPEFVGQENVNNPLIHSIFGL